MKEQDIIDLIRNEGFQTKIKLEDIPEIDLYMDQVIQLFESKLSGVKRNDEDKVLTKTMVNNYAKAKLLMSVKNKKYSKEHLVLMSLIYELKGALSISDIKILLTNIVEKFEKGEDYDLRGLYSKYSNICNEDNKIIEENIKSKMDSIQEENYEEKFLLISSMISMSNMYRRISELLIDNLFDDKDLDK